MGDAWLGFVLGTCGWAFILLEVCLKVGQASNAGPHIKKSYLIMKFIVSVGWSIYPAGYYFGYLVLKHSDDVALNLIYNLADFVNKIAFVLAIWTCAKRETGCEIGRQQWHKGLGTLQHVYCEYSFHNFHV